MRVDELKDAVDGIRMKEDRRQAMIENIKRHTEKSVSERTLSERVVTGGRKTRQLKRLAAAAAAVLVVAGIAVVPVRALVSSLIRERVEEMPQEEKDAYVETLEEPRVSADGFSRAYTEEEETRYAQLAQKYQEGLFPEKAVVQVDTEEEAAGYEFCFLKPMSMFCLPERELTDEELLQIIDFMVKREYAQREAYAKENEETVAAREQEQKEAVEENVEGGGITQEEAIEIATRKVSEIFGADVTGFERNAYYNGPEEEWEWGANYCVNWSNIISGQYYYFWIDPADGHMLSASYSGKEIHSHAFAVSLEEAENRIPELREKAAKFMSETMRESYSKTYVYYQRGQDGTADDSGVRFYFSKEDQSAWVVMYTWDGMLHEVRETDILDLEDGRELELWTGDAYIKVETVVQELDE